MRDLKSEMVNQYYVFGHHRSEPSRLQLWCGFEIEGSDDVTHQTREEMRDSM